MLRTKMTVNTIDKTPAKPELSWDIALKMHMCERPGGFETSFEDNWPEMAALVRMGLVERIPMGNGVVCFIAC